MRNTFWPLSHIFPTFFSTVHVRVDSVALVRLPDPLTWQYDDPATPAPGVPQLRAGPAATVSTWPTFPAVGTGASHRSLAVLARVTAPPAIVGFGYVDPFRSPPAAPLGGNEVGIAGNA